MGLASKRKKPGTEIPPRWPQKEAKGILSEGRSEFTQSPILPWKQLAKPQLKG